MNVRKQKYELATKNQALHAVFRDCESATHHKEPLSEGLFRRKLIFRHSSRRDLTLQHSLRQDLSKGLLWR